MVGFSESRQSEYDAAETGLVSVERVRLKIDKAGRIVIPAEMRAAMLVKPGDTVTARVVDGEKHARRRRKPMPGGPHTACRLSNRR